MRKRNLLDSFAVLAFLKKESKYQTVLALLNDAKEGRRDLLMNQINAGEVYYQVLKRGLTHDIDKFWRIFLMLPIQFWQMILILFWKQLASKAAMRFLLQIALPWRRPFEKKPRSSPGIQNSSKWRRSFR